MVTLYSPNGQFGCLTVRVGKLVVCVGLVWHMRGVDIIWNGRALVGGIPE